MTEETATVQEAQVARVEMEITIDAPRDRVWRALVEETTEWWLPDFYTMPGARFIIEPKIGGRAYEDGGDGNGLIWFNVTGVRTLESLHLTGYLHPSSGGPAVSLVTISLEDTPAGATTLKLTDGLLGRFNAKEMEEGWPYLFRDGLKVYVEGKF